MKHLLLTSFLLTAFFLTSCLDDTEKTDAPPVEFSSTAVDSLFEELLLRVEDAESELSNSMDMNTLVGLEFSDLAQEFSKYTAGGDMKANVGYIVAEMASMNKSTSLKKLADSLDSYFSISNSDPIDPGDGYGTEYASLNAALPQVGIVAPAQKSTLVASAYAENGIDGLAVALIAKTPSLVRATTASASFPTFITLSHIQDIIENEISNRLDKVIAALERIETYSSDQSMTFTAFGETVELDIADLYVLDASMHALRAPLKLICARDLDLYGPGTTNYQWLGDIVNSAEAIDYDDGISYRSTEVSVSSDNDTLYENSTRLLRPQDKEIYGQLYDVIAYNLNRPGFGTIRRANHATAYADFKAIPTKLRRALDALDAETDNQENDLIQKVLITDASEEMLSLKEYFLEENLSEEFANNFTSPRSVLDFVEEILAGPYRFNETINGVTFDLTMDISQYFLNPADNILDYLPKYRLKNKSDSYMMDTYTSTDHYSSSWVYINDGTFINNIPSEKIEYQGSYDIGLVTPYTLRIAQGTYETFMPVELFDGKGNALSPFDAIYDLEEGQVPYFEDYTFRGIFPGMTREKWNTQLSNLWDAL